MRILNVLMVVSSLLMMRPLGVSAADSDFDTQMMEIYAQYRVIHQALAADRGTSVKESGLKIATLAKDLDVSKVSAEHAAHFKGLPEKISAAAEGLAKATDLAAQRDAFRALSKPMAMWASMDQESGLNVVFCSMAKGSWLQDDASIKNPYMGSKMLGCGEVVSGPATPKHPAANSNGSKDHAGHDMSTH